MKTLERVARAIAKSKDFDPDQACTNYILHTTNGISRLPPAPAVSPAWVFFVADAFVAMKEFGIVDEDEKE